MEALTKGDVIARKVREAVKILNRALDEAEELGLRCDVTVGQVVFVGDWESAAEDRDVTQVKAKVYQELGQ